ncbi:MAG: PAS domain-containing protein [Candidatus Dadabacteria bacterium]|nr:PAS domain-containing protein [Candidatus Dadabacteria bacterium]
MIFFVILIALGIVAALFTHELNTSDPSNKQDALMSSINLLSDTLRPALKTGDSEALTGLLREAGRKTGIRFTVTDAQGNVTADTLRVSTKPRNLSTSKEFTGAVREGMGIDLRREAPGEGSVLYVALPIRDEGGRVSAVLMASAPLEERRGGPLYLTAKIVLAALILSFIVMAIEIVSKRELARSLETASRISEEIAKGNFDVEISVKDGSPEGAKLALALSGMAEKLKELFYRVDFEKSQLEAVISAMAEGVIAVSVDGRIILANQSLRNMLELTETPIHKPYWEVLRNREVIELLKTVLENKKSDKREIYPFYPSEKSYMVSALPLGTPAGGAIVMLFDITEFKRLEKIKADFVANVSHELKTPLTAVKGYVETLYEGAYDDQEQQSQFLSIIKRHTERLINIVNDLLVLSEIERKTALFGEETGKEFRNVDLKLVLQSSIDALKTKIDAKKISLELNITEPEPRCSGDAFLLEQMFINLLENAVKYTPEQGSVNLSVSAGPTQIKVEIRDTGIGIPSEHLPRIFERFYRVDKSRSSKMGGTGLGLSIVKHIAIMHGGAVDVESEVGVGSKFTVALPHFVSRQLSV